MKHLIYSPPVEAATFFFLSFFFLGGGVGNMQPLEASELVQCSAHRTKRLAKFCSSKAVYDGMGKVLGFTYECLPEHRCGGTMLGTATIVTNIIATDTADMRLSAEARQTLEASGRQIAQGGAANTVKSTRYYDLSSQKWDEDRPKKVCWACGMDSHERPSCTNQLCKKCHAKTGPGHECADPFPSPFVVLVRPTEEELFASRCPTCGVYGHLDCHAVEPMAAGRILSCCYCAGSGHLAFDCPRQEYPDKWIASIIAFARRTNYHHHHHGESHHNPNPLPQDRAGMHGPIAQRYNVGGNQRRYERDDRAQRYSGDPSSAGHYRPQQNTEIRDRYRVDFSNTGRHGSTPHEHRQHKRHRTYSSSDDGLQF